MTTPRITTFAAASFAALLGSLPAQAGDPGKAPIGEEPLIIDDDDPQLITLKIDSRLRYEMGDQEGSDTAHAGTLRNRIGFLTKDIGGFQLFAEYEGTVTPDRFSYNSVVDGDPTKTVIADPESHEVNQLWGSYKLDFLDEGLIKAGRQAIALDGQRFVGGVAWRQNMQTFDAATVTFSPVEGGKFFYSYINRVNRIFGSQADAKGPAGVTDFQGNTHLVNFSYDGLPIGKLTTYAYFMDLGNDAGDANSNHTFGVSLSGDVFDSPLSYYAEYAYQTDAFDSNLDYAASYGHGSLSMPIGDLKVTIGAEYLGGDNGVGFKTPLATLHKFNGFADRFLGTPGNGLTDLYASVSAPLPFKLKGLVAYHYFQDDSFGDEFGQEVDFVLSRPITKNLTALAKWAYFDGEGSFKDLNRLVVELNYKF